jgi:hypothetical protein
MVSSLLAASSATVGGRKERVYSRPLDRGYSGAPRTWAAIEAVARDNGLSFQQIADEAFADFLRKHKQPVGFMDSLKESVAVRKPTRSKKR